MPVSPMVSWLCAAGASVVSAVLSSSGAERLVSTSAVSAAGSVSAVSAGAVVSAAVVAAFMSTWVWLPSETSVQPVIKAAMVQSAAKAAIIFFCMKTPFTKGRVSVTIPVHSPQSAAQRPSAPVDLRCTSQSVSRCSYPCSLLYHGFSEKASIF